MSAVAEPTTHEELVAVARELDAELGAAPIEPDDASELAAWFASLRERVLAMARSSAWREHELARDLLVGLEDLRDGVSGSHWEALAALKRMQVVVDAMARRFEREAIDEPSEAATYLLGTLDRVGDGELAELVGVSARTIENWRAGRVASVRKNADRVVLVAQLVYDLRTTLSQRGIVLWFHAPRRALGGRTALDLLEIDVADAAERLRPLARAGRGQLAA